MNFFINGFLVVQACLGRQADYTANQFKPSLFSWFARRIAVLPAARRLVLIFVNPLYDSGRLAEKAT